MNNPKKTYEVFVKYSDGNTESKTIVTDNIQWSIDQFIRNRKSINNLNVQLTQDGKEEQG